MDQKLDVLDQLRAVLRDEFILDSEFKVKTLASAAMNEIERLQRVVERRAISPPIAGEKWRNIRNGDVYKVLHVSSLEVEHTGADACPVVVYSSLPYREADRVFTCPVPHFVGRFTRIEGASFDALARKLRDSVIGPLGMGIFFEALPTGVAIRIEWEDDIWRFVIPADEPDPLQWVNRFVPLFIDLVKADLIHRQERPS